MSNLYQIKRDIQKEYTSTSDTAERYMILKELEDHISSLREETALQIKNGTYGLVSTDEILNKIRRLLQEASSLHLDSVDAVVHEDSKVVDVFEELMMDSLDYVEFVMALEEEFDIEISDFDAEKFTTISEIISLINAKK